MIAYPSSGECRHSDHIAPEDPPKCYLRVLLFILRDHEFIRVSNQWETAMKLNFKQIPNVVFEIVQNKKSGKIAKHRLNLSILSNVNRGNEQK
jgi:hypothetical protein